MKRLRTLLIKFDHSLSSSAVSAFRGAVIEKVGRENILFNHHINDKQYLFKYPLVQYKSIRGKSAIYCLDAGVDEIHKFFNQKTWEIWLKGKKVDLEIDKLDLNNFTLNVWNKSYDYALNKWLALSSKNYHKYKQQDNDIDRVEMLEKILTGNILAFAKGVDWHIDKQIKVRIHEIRKAKNIKFKNTHLLAFDVDFSSNVFLPNFIGLGKGASRGMGMVNAKKTKNNE